MANGIEWMPVRRGLPPYLEIGAVGFVEGRIAIIGAYFGNKDTNYDGRVGIGERLAFSTLFSNKNFAVADVAGEAAMDPDILMRDNHEIAGLSGELMMRHFGTMVGEAAYNLYFKRSMRGLAKPIAASLVKGAFSQFVVRRGMERAVKRAVMEGYDEALSGA